MDREAWRAAIHGGARSRTRLSEWTELNWRVLYMKVVFSLPWKSPLMHKHLIFIKSNLSIFSLFFLVFCAKSKNTLPNLRLHGFNHMFSSNSFITLSIIFRSLIHFELIFVYGIRLISNFIFFFWHVIIQLFQHYLLKKTVLSFLNDLSIPVNWP